MLKYQQKSHGGGLLFYPCCAGINLAVATPSGDVQCIETHDIDTLTNICRLRISLYSRPFFMLYGTRGVGLQLPIDVSTPSISGAWTMYCVFHMQPMPLVIQAWCSTCQAASHQSLPSLRRDGCVYLATLTEPIYHRIIPVPSERPSTVSRQTGSAREVGQGEYGFVRLISTSDNTILASIQRGVNSCSVKSAPPDDDDDAAADSDMTTAAVLTSCCDGL